MSCSLHMFLVKWQLGLICRMNKVIEFPSVIRRGSEPFAPETDSWPRPQDFDELQAAAIVHIAVRLYPFVKKTNFPLAVILH